MCVSMFMRICMCIPTIKTQFYSKIIILKSYSVFFLSSSKVQDKCREGRPVRPDMLTGISRGYLSIWIHLSADSTQRFREGIKNKQKMLYLGDSTLTIVWPQQTGQLWCLSRNFNWIRDPNTSKMI